MNLLIPEEYTEFLFWVKEKTESFWSGGQKDDSGFICDDWLRDAKWIGMTDDEIVLAEERYNVKFTDYHKMFLKILHTVDKKQVVSKNSLNSNFEQRERSLFYNWNTDHEQINEYLKWPYKVLLKSVLKDGVWLTSWGEEPEDTKEKELIFSKWFQGLPKLIPINRHRFIISEPEESDNPVLSAHGRDTIIYGRNMRHYLLSELEANLGLLQYIYDEEEEVWHEEPTEQLLQIHKQEFDLLKEMKIPGWREFLISNGFNDYLEKPIKW